jgi:hypothetical protein
MFLTTSTTEKDNNEHNIPVQKRRSKHQKNEKYEKENIEKWTKKRLKKTAVQTTNQEEDKVDKKHHW